MRRAEIAGWLAFAATRLSALAEARRVAMLGAEAISSCSASRAATAAPARGSPDDAPSWPTEIGWWERSPTIADIAVFPHVMLSHDSGIGHEDYPAINLWQRRVRRLPGFVGMPGIPDYF